MEKHYLCEACILDRTMRQLLRTANQDALPQAQSWFFWAQLPI